MMKFRQFVLTFLSMAIAISALSATVSAARREPNYTLNPMYEIAKNPKSELIVFDTEANCVSNIFGTNVLSITAEQTLQKYAETWTSVNGANWISTANSNSISVQNTKSGLSSGTYRLKTVFTLTDTNGKTETITVYSDEKTVT